MVHPNARPVICRARHGVLLVALGQWGAIACQDPPVTGQTEAASSTSSTSSTTTGSTTADDLDTTTLGDDHDVAQVPPPSATMFEVTVTNVSEQSLLVSPLSAGLWVNHAPALSPLFTPFVPDEGLGLEALAEDGDPHPLAAALGRREDLGGLGVFETPEGAASPGPLQPGDHYAFSLEAEPGTRLSLAMMVVASNDVFIAPEPQGLSLFGAGGQPLPERDVSDSLLLWDAGTERNEAPAQGPWQALHGGSPDLGPSEASTVEPHAHSTRALPLGPDLVEVRVQEDPLIPGTLTVRVTNVTGSQRLLTSSLSSLVWAVHDDGFTLFEEGQAASAPLEALAEDGDAGPYDAWLGGQAGVAEHGMIEGPIYSLGEVEFSITPGPAASRLSLAAMLVQTNDAFVALPPSGQRLLDDQGEVLTGEALTEQIAARLNAWDAGTEINQVPGVGLDQPLRQAAPNTGAPDPDPTVRRYLDLTDDLQGDLVGGTLQVTVTPMGPQTMITLTNVSDTTAFPLQLGSVVWALHDGTVSVFEPGQPATSGIEFLAEEDYPIELWNEFMLIPGIGGSGVIDTPAGEVGSDRIGPGQSYEIVVTPDAVFRYLELVAMLLPSNDTFVALDAPGVALVDEAGVPRDPAVIEAELSAALRAWDAGTEGNQAGASGADMNPLGSGNPPEGTQTVGPVANGRWSLPRPRDLVRVVVAPVEG